MTRAILIGDATPRTAGERLVAETARLVADELTVLASADEAATAGPVDLLFGAANPALARRLGALFVPVETIGLGGRASLPAMLPAREHPPATICVHGPESTGKSVLAERLAERFGTIWVPEYGRAHCELYGTDLDEAGLLLIGQVQDAMIRASAGWADGRMFADTDALMTAAWCQMMLGTMPDILFEYAKADLYLMLEPDVPWQGDSVRIYGDAQAREKFRMVCREVLDRAGVRWLAISGDWETRFAQAVGAI